MTWAGVEGYTPLTSIVTAMLLPSPLHPKERKLPDLNAPMTSAEGRPSDEWIEFRPARWLVATVALLWLWLVRPQFGKRALAVFAWRSIPGRLKLIAACVATVALVVLAGSVRPSSSCSISWLRAVVLSPVAKGVHGRPGQCSGMSPERGWSYSARGWTLRERPAGA